MNAAVPFVTGALATCYVVASLFFARFWQQTRDRLFLLFGAAFFLLATHRVLLTFARESAALYVIRLAAFLLILVAIVDKNRS